MAMFLRRGFSLKNNSLPQRGKGTVALGIFFGAPGLDNGGGHAILPYN